MKNHKAVLEKLDKLLNKPVHGHALILFRIIFGLTFSWQTASHYFDGTIEEYFIKPIYFFQMEIFEFLPALPDYGFYMLFGALFALGLMVAAGVFLSFSIWSIVLLYGYICFLSKAYYNNHYYFIWLLFILMGLTLKYYKVPFKQLLNKGFKIPYWPQAIIQFQICIVYFYGGLAKLNYDWLVSHEPIKTWYKEFAVIYNLEFLGQDYFTAFISYSGLLFDLLIPFMLFSKRLRWLAIVHLFSLSSN